MSMPSCIRPQRQPNGLTTGPLTGQTNPLAEGEPSLEDEYVTVDCAERICAATLALWALSAAASEAYWRASARTSARLARRSRRAAESPCCSEISWFLSERCCSVLILTTRVTVATR